MRVVPPNLLNPWLWACTGCHHTHITSSWHCMYQVERVKLEVQLDDRYVGLIRDIWTNAAI